jgi:hypothetical protein
VDGAAFSFDSAGDVIAADGFASHARTSSAENPFDGLGIVIDRSHVLAVFMLHGRRATESEGASSRRRK